MKARNNVNSRVFWIGGALVALLGLAAVNRNTPVGPPVMLDSIPARPAPVQPLAARFPADEYGRFWIDGAVNGVAFKLLADTGSDFTLTFSKSDARRLGIDVRKLKFTDNAVLANGEIVPIAPVRVAKLSLGPFATLNDIPAWVFDAEKTSPLVGRPILNRWNVFIAKGTLTLSES